MKYNTAKALILIALLCAGCTEKGDHSGYNIYQIEVLLKGGGSAVLVCPKYDRSPAGSHGQECYLKAED